AVGTLHAFQRLLDHDCRHIDIVVPSERNGRDVMDLANNHFSRIQEFDGQTPVGDDEPADHAIMLTLLLGIPVRNLDSIVLLVKMFTDGTGNKHRPVPASSTADRNRYVGFALFLVLRKKKIDKRIDMIEEFV